MLLQFSAQQIEAWAGLSGDRNPIHFDSEAARRMNAPDIVVHGMLVLLAVKQRLGRAFTPAATDWIQFKALLKVPVLRNSAVLLSTLQRDETTRFRLHPVDGGSDCISGNTLLVAAPEWASKAAGFVIGHADAKRWLAQFKAELDIQVDDWVALDALIFSRFIGGHLGVIFDRLSPALRQQVRPDRLEDLSQHLIVQTSHQIVCRPAQVSLDALRSDIRCEIDNIELIESPGRAVGTLDLGVLIGNRHVMTITLGLMLKTLTPTQGDSQ